MIHIENKSILRCESGAALLAFMLVLITAVSFLLVSKLNANIQIAAGEEETRTALNQAKQALIGYAISYPDTINSIDGPGYLPCPDTDNDGDAEGNCSSAGNTTIGRLPYETLELFELNDASGQRFWYAISENFRYGANKTIPLNNESPSNALLSVNGSNDIVAVIIAPGAPVGAQSRDPNDNVMVNEIQNYLEDDNNDLDVSFVTTANGDFNDVVAVITRDELMHAIEKRVLGEVSMMLTGYRSIHGAYPWLTPFADPKADQRRLTGYAGAASGGLTLDDSTQDFSAWGVAVGDIVYNITDGSRGVVSFVNDSESITVSSLLYGANNVFSEDDRYAVVVNFSAPTFSGTVGAGSSVLSLTDDDDDGAGPDVAKDFKELGVSSGDIIDNITTGLSSMVEEVLSSTQLNVKDNGIGFTFTTGNSYQIRSNVSQATTDTDTNGLTLEDTNKNFTTMGILAGDIVVNDTDGSMGRVTAVTANRLTVDRLNFGTENDFDFGDYYSISRYNTDNNTRKGLLAFHEEGKLFPTAFDVDFSITADSSDVSFDTTDFSGTQATYQTALVTFLTSYASTSLTDSIDLSEGVCSWFSPKVADCYFYYPPENINISGTITSGSDTSVITDSNADFVTDGVKRGDIVQNFDDEYALSPPVSGAADKGGATGVATGGSNNLLLEDTSKDFINLGILIGDTITNSTDGSSGTIASVSTSEITVTLLTGGTNNVFNAGDNYNILGNSVLYDADADFNTAGIAAYQYLVYNDTTGVRAVITEVIDDNTIKAVELDNQTSPIIFTSGNNYTVYTPGIVVITDVPSSTVANTTRASVYNPDFDFFAGPYEEYYRILTAADSFNSTATSASGNTLTDTSRNFINEGVIPGDIIENVTDVSSFGEITNVTTNTITATLYGGTLNTFTALDSYIIYHNYVYSRRAEWHARFSGDQETKTLSEKRVRDVCLGYSTNDCSVAPTAVSFSGYGGVPLITIRDYAKDGVTEVGRATFTPSVSSSGSLRVADIDFYPTDRGYRGLSGTHNGSNGSSNLIDTTENFNDWGVQNGDIVRNITDGSIGTVSGVTATTLTVSGLSLGTENDFDDDDKYAVSSSELPDWFLKNKWHQLVYVANSAGDVPGAAAACIAGTNCLNLNVDGIPYYNDKHAIAIIAGEETETTLDASCNATAAFMQDRSTGLMNAYYELENCDQDDDFQRAELSTTFNDQTRIIQ